MKAAGHTVVTALMKVGVTTPVDLVLVGSGDALPQESILRHERRCRVGRMRHCSVVLVPRSTSWSCWPHPSLCTALHVGDTMYRRVWCRALQFSCGKTCAVSSVDDILHRNEHPGESFGGRFSQGKRTGSAAEVNGQVFSTRKLARWVRDDITSLLESLSNKKL